jgi:hypothetical protein
MNKRAIGFLIGIVVSFSFVHIANGVESGDFDLDRVDNLHQEGKYEEIIQYTDEFLAINPDDVFALFYKALALHDSGQFEEAILYYDKILEINPKDIDALNNKGVALDDLGRYEEAKSYYEKVLEINPTDPDAIYNLAEQQEFEEISQIDENQEDSEPSWGSIIGIIIGVVIVSVIGPWIKKRNTKNLLKKKELFRRPSFFVKQIRWTSSNITYAVLFDKEGILLVHAQKIKKAPKESTIFEIIKMSKHNVYIPWGNVSQLEFVKNEEGSDGARAGTFHIESTSYKGNFDISLGQDFDECQKIGRLFWPPNNPNQAIK